MNNIRSYNHWSTLNEAVKDVVQFGTDSQYSNFFWIKGVLLMIGWNMQEMNINELKAKFNELGFNFDSMLDECYEDSKLQGYHSQHLFESFLSGYLVNQPGVIGITFGNFGELVLLPNKNFHYENSPVLYKLLQHFKSRGITEIQPPDRYERLPVVKYMEEMKPNKDKVVLPKFYYHGTSSQHLVSILRNGIAPSTKSNHNIQHENKVFITTSLKTAKEYALNAASNTFHATNNGQAYTDYEDIVFKIDSKYLDMARMSVDYDLYIHFMRNNTVPSYDAAISKRMEKGDLVDMRTTVRNNINPALFYKVAYEGTILPQSFVSIIHYNNELTIAEAKKRFLEGGTY